MKHEPAVADPAERAVGWVAVGLGGYARERMLPALGRARGTRLVGMYPRTEPVRRDVAEEYGGRGYGSLGRGDGAMRKSGLPRWELGGGLFQPKGIA